MIICLNELQSIVMLGFAIYGLMNITFKLLCFLIDKRQEEALENK